jgi:hypothetical protein
MFASVGAQANSYENPYSYESDLAAAYLHSPRLFSKEGAHRMLSWGLI